MHAREEDERKIIDTHTHTAAATVSMNKQFYSTQKNGTHRGKQKRGSQAQVLACAGPRFP